LEHSRKIAGIVSLPLHLVMRLETQFTRFINPRAVVEFVSIAALKATPAVAGAVAKYHSVSIQPHSPILEGMLLMWVRF